MTDTDNDTTTVVETVTNVAAEVAKELAITVAGCGVALILTAGASSVIARLRNRKSEKESDIDTVTGPIV